MANGLEEMGCQRQSRQCYQALLPVVLLNESGRPGRPKPSASASLAHGELQEFDAHDFFSGPFRAHFADDLGYASRTGKISSFLHRLLSDLFVPGHGPGKEGWVWVWLSVGCRKS